MPAAARVGDVTTHGGTVLGPGDPTVMIGGMPAAVATDTHACPLPAPPHLPTSPFPLGSVTVLAGGKPLLRVGDMAVCGAAPAVGCPTVLAG